MSGNRPSEARKYIVIWDGDGIYESDHFPDELMASEYAQWITVIRLSDLHFWYREIEEWCPLRDLPHPQLALNLTIL